MVTLKPKLTMKQLEFRCIDRQLFVDNVAHVDLVDHSDVHGLAEILTDNLYACVVKSVPRVQEVEHSDDSPWLLQDDDDSRVWSNILEGCVWSW